MRKILFLLLMIVLFDNSCYGITNQPLNFMVTYHNETILSDGTKLIFTSKFFCKENKKFRCESISKINDREVPDSLSIEIKRLDLNLIRKLEPKEKKCIEQQLTPETSFLPLIDNWKKLKAESEKICETRILDYDCEMFQKKDDPEHVFWLTKDTGILLREEMEFENGKHISIAKELNFEILDDSLFEIPNDYTILKLKLSTDEDLQKAPPLTMQNVQEFLLKGLHIVFLIKEENLELLSANKTQLLKESILTGMDFKEVTYTEINEKEAIKSNPQFLITTDNNIAFLIYDIATGYLYIRKKDIYQKNEADHYYDEKWRNKFLMGGYKIKLSEEFRQIID